MKKILICGASGMVGAALTAVLRAKDQQFVLLGRSSEKIRGAFPYDVEALAWDELPAYDASTIGVVVNLAGAGVSDEKWTEAYKNVMRESRLETTRHCVELCRRNTDIRLINASAVSAYGFYDHEHEPFTENDRDRRTGSCFLQRLIDDWEATAMQAAAFGNAVVLMRIGVVLDRNGGGLPAMAQPFQHYIGGPAGSGDQVMSWISLHDLVHGIDFVIGHPELNGPVNMVSPGACSQKEFARALGKALGKPGSFPSPSFLIKALMGQMGQELILTGQRVVPEKLRRAGFVFHDSDIAVFLERHYRNT